MNGYRSGLRNFLACAVLLSLLLECVGCEAFVRKFTRKKKKEDMPKVEMVLVPEEFHAPQIPKEDLYTQYFTFWKSWQTELIESLSGNSINKKKQLSCVREALKNLKQLQPLLKEEQQKALEGYIAKEAVLGNEIEDDIYGNAMVSQRSSAERLLRAISKDFSYHKIKDSLR